MTAAQANWLAAHPGYTSIGRPRPGIYFREAGTLYADGSFEPMAPMKTIVLKPGCFGVGIPEPVK